MREKVLLHAVVRFDRYLLDVAAGLTDFVTVVAVLPTRDEADREVARLTNLQSDDGCIYFWTPARYYPNGRGAGEGAHAE